MSEPEPTDSPAGPDFQTSDEVIDQLALARIAGELMADDPFSELHGNASRPPEPQLRDGLGPLLGELLGELPAVALHARQRLSSSMSRRIAAASALACSRMRPAS